MVGVGLWVVEGDVHEYAAVRMGPLRTGAREDLAVGMGSRVSDTLASTTTLILR